VTAALLVAATPVGGEILMRHGADRPSSGGSVRSPASTRPGPPGPPLPILAAPLRSLLAPREGPAASLRGGLEAPAGPSDHAPARARSGAPALRGALGQGRPAGRAAPVPGDDVGVRRSIAGNSSHAPLWPTRRDESVRTEAGDACRWAIPLYAEANAKHHHEV